LAVEAPEYAQTTYDKVALSYDELYSRHVAAPNARLTAGLRLAPGERLADIACGTGLYTVDMAREVAPGETVGVDFSEGMLAAARERAESEGLSLSLVNARAEDFLASSPPAHYDAVSLRFALAYIDWEEVLPQIGRILRPGGRVGVLTSLTSSIPQFYKLFVQFRGSFEPAWKLFNHTGRSFPETFRMFRQLRATFADGDFITVPDSTEAIAAALARGGLTTDDAWTDRVRLWFTSGTDMIAWMHSSGYVTHQSLEEVGPDAVKFLHALFSEGLETFREPRGIPLDLVMAGVVARK
jgi:ubiquinone/menaquinone biosynthesis C-methylase UbiE